jgi:mannose/fructose/N-acetylgalactosamine-specific phosphotransferase system component IIC
LTVKFTVLGGVSSDAVNIAISLPFSLLTVQLMIFSYTVSKPIVRRT